MGTARKKKKELQTKLKQIREALGLSQNEIIELLNIEDEVLTQTHISRYELGKREPSLYTVLAYSRLCNISADYLLDDDLELPAQIPSKKFLCPRVD